VYPLRVNTLLGRGKGIFEDAMPDVTMESLEGVFSSRDGMILPDAAFLAGRCQPDAQEDRERLDTLLRELLASLPVDNLGIMASPYIEAAMSLALRGDPEAARRALVPLVTDAAASTGSEGYLAAFYLAQMGDPSGWPAMLACLHYENNQHTRLMATRHLIGFRPYDGQTVRDGVVDVRAELAQRLRDSHTRVRVEVPGLLAEACVEDLQELLSPVAQGDEDENVRRAARDVLERLKGE